MSTEEHVEFLKLDSKSYCEGSSNVICTWFAPLIISAKILRSCFEPRILGIYSKLFFPSSVDKHWHRTKITPAMSKSPFDFSAEIISKKLKPIVMVGINYHANHNKQRKQKAHEQDLWRRGLGTYRVNPLRRHLQKSFRHL